MANDSGNDKVIRIGGASGYWGESAMATPQLLTADIDYLGYDYLAEITMSIMARAHAKNPEAGFATDFYQRGAEAACQSHCSKGRQAHRQCGWRQSGGLRRGGAGDYQGTGAGFEGRGDYR